MDKKIISDLVNKFAKSANVGGQHGYPLGLQQVVQEDGCSLTRFSSPATSTSSPKPTKQSTPKSSDPSTIAWYPYSSCTNTSHTVQHEQQTNDSGHCCLPSQIIPSSDSDSSSLSESFILNPKIISEVGMMALSKENASTMTVKKASFCHHNLAEDYKMTAKPRGPCLIINNIDFDSDIFPQRKGSDQDARRFDDVFQQLGFAVFLRRNQTAEQMKSLCKEIASKCKKEHDALFVILLSHGSECGIYGSDGIEVDLNDIITYFDNKHCKAMIGKPKVFVIQACRGRMVDYGEKDSIDAVSVQQETSSINLSYDNYHSQIPFSRRSEFVKNRFGNSHPIRTDMLLIFSCLAGYVSVRNELAGSWLGVALTYFIMTSAHEKDLYRILNLVSADIRDRVSSDGHTQCIEVTSLGWTKNLYFNPGIYL